MRIVILFQELNVKQVTTSKDKEKYGLRLKADLDFQRLGRRLKQDFKKVQAAIKCITFFFVYQRKFFLITKNSFASE